MLQIDNLYPPVENVFIFHTDHFEPHMSIAKEMSIDLPKTDCVFCLKAA